MVAMESGGVSPFPASRTSTPSSQNPNGPRQTKICVYCGSMPGESPAHMEAARELARTMAANNIGLGESLGDGPCVRSSMRAPPNTALTCMQSMGAEQSV